MEKVKVNLSYSNYSTLIHDAETFGFYKPNGEVNKNHFYNEVVKALYLERHNKSEAIRNFYKNELSQHIYDNDIINDLVSKISRSINNATNDFENQYHDYSILIRPSKAYENIYETIFETHLIDDTISNYFRNLFFEYCSLEQDDREILLFNNLYQQIMDAIYNKKIIKIKVGGMYYKFIPYAVAKTKEKLFNYVVGFTLNKHNEKFLASYHLYKIESIIEVNEYVELEDYEINKLDQLIIKGPQYKIDYYTSACIELTKEGQRMWKLLYLNRPNTTKIEDNKYYFDCSIIQLEQYFVRFGKNAKVIYPNTLKFKLRKFYKEALNSIYSNDEKITSK